jgi:hypothetical protein
MRHLATISAFWMVALISNTNAIDVDLQNYRCSQFLADTKDPSDGGKLLKSMMMISWSTGYAAAYQKQKPRADPAALRLMAVTLGMNCAKAPDRNATDVLADLVKQFTADASAQPTPQSNEIVLQPSSKQQGPYTVYDNFDLPGADIRRIEKVDTEKCAHECTTTEACKAYSFDKWNKWCFLKSSSATLVLEPSSLTAIKADAPKPQTSTAATRIDRRSGKSLIGSPLRDASVSSADECESTCRGEAKCVGYTFLKSHKQCKLFAGIESFASNSSASSGVKTQSAP